MADIIGATLMNWGPILGPILGPIHISIKLASKLYNQLEKNSENKKVGKKISNKLDLLKDNLELYAAGSNISQVHSSVAKTIREKIATVNKEIIQLCDKIEKNRLYRYARAKKINEELKAIDASVEHLETNLNTFGLVLNNRKAQNVQIELSRELLEENKQIKAFLQKNKQLKAFLQIHNVPAAEGDSRSTITSVEGMNTSENDFDEREDDQADAFENIPGLVNDIKESNMEERYKNKLIAALEDSANSWKIPFEDLEFVKVKGQNKLIGTGGFKKVFEGKIVLNKNNDDGDSMSVRVAVLQYDISGADLRMRKGEILREIYLSWRLQHPCIITMHGAFWPEESEQGIPPRIFTELMTHNLRNARFEKALQSPKVRFSIAVDIAEAIHFLHKNKFIHRDIKPENVLLRIVDDELVSRAKVSDFGASKEIRSTLMQQAMRIGGSNELTPMYAPPEEFSGYPPKYAYDMWGYGLLLCWLDGDRRKAPRVTAFNAASLAADGKLQQMTRKWVDSIENGVLKKCAQICTSSKPEARGNIDGILRILKEKKTVAKNETPEKIYRDAEALENQGKYKKAIELYRIAADSGHSMAQNQLGYMYKTGFHVTKDCNRAVELFKLAADKGYMSAQYNLGLMYRDGQGVPQDDTRAAEHYKLAAEQGYVRAQNNLGWMYQHGEGVPQDNTRAAELYKLAADQGDAFAQSNLGWMYNNGQGVPQDDTRAAELYKLAADQRDASAQCNLGWMYENGRGVTQDDTRAAELYKHATDQGFANAQNNLGNFYKNGKGVTQDDTRAAKLYKLAADQRNASAQCNLGRMYENGRGVTQDVTRAAELYKLAADQGHEHGQACLADMYEHGKGVAKNYKKAVELYSRAAEQGEQFAQGRLKKLRKK